MKASELLRDATASLAAVPADNLHGLCVALAGVRGKLKRTGVAPETIQEASKRIEAQIKCDLGGHLYLHRWLLAEGYVSYGELQTPEGRERLRATRIAWAEDLIRYFESKGD